MSFNCGCSAESVLCHGRKRWYHQPLWSKTGVYIYSGFIVDERFSHKFIVYDDDQTGRCDLIIKSVELTDAGLYTCKSSRNESFASTSSLTVYGMNIIHKIVISDLKCPIISRTADLNF